MRHHHVAKALALTLLCLLLVPGCEQGDEPVQVALILSGASGHYWENIVEANAWYTSDNISKLGKPVDKDEWHMSPQTVNAYYNPTTNEICFPARLVHAASDFKQEPMF